MKIAFILVPLQMLCRLALVSLIFITYTAHTASARVVYVRGDNAPWEKFGNESAMNDVFGSGNWDELHYESTTGGAVFTPTTTFVFMEGGDGTAQLLEDFLTANSVTITAWVNAGGRLLVNSAPNEGDGMSMLFDVELIYSETASSSSPIGTAVSGAHPIFTGPNAPVSTNLTGDSFSHAYLSGAGLTNIILDENSRPILAEKNFGNGKVVFGGLTLPWYYDSELWTQPDSGHLLKNLIVYTSAYTATLHNVLFTKGNPVPNVAGKTFTTFGTPAVNALGQVAFLGKWTGGAGIFVDGVLVVKVGDVISGTAAIKSLKDAVIDDAGYVAFPCTLIGADISPANDAAIVSNAPGGVLSIIAQEGTQAAGAPAGALYKSFASTAAPGGGGGVIILGSMAQGISGITATTDSAVWSADSAGTLHMVLQEGTTVIGTKTVRNFSVLKVVNGTPGQTHAHNTVGQLVSNVTFTDGFQALVRTNLP